MKTVMQELIENWKNLTNSEDPTVRQFGEKMIKDGIQLIEKEKQHSIAFAEWCQAYENSNKWTTEQLYQLFITTCSDTI